MRCCILLFFLFLTPPALAQNEYRSLHFFTTKNGLTNNIIQCITRDSRGFLWIGTLEGLNRFDGFQFKSYYASRDMTDGLASNSVFAVLEYGYGQLLIGTGNGISVLNTITGKFENGKIKNPALRVGSGTQIHSFYKDRSGHIWVNSNGELDVLDSNLTDVQRFTDLPWARSLKGIKVVFEKWSTDQMGRLWLPSDASGINIIDFASKQVYNQSNNPDKLPFLEFTYIRSMLLDPARNEIWYAPWGMGLYKYNFTTKKIKHQLFAIKDAGEKRSINCILKTRGGELLGASGSHLYRIDTASLNISMAEEDLLFKGNFSPIDSYRDEENGWYWFGTSHGLLQFTDASVAKNLVINNKVPEIYFSNLVTAKQKIYALYTGHLVEVEASQDQFHVYKLPNEKSVTEGLCADQEGLIWIGTSDGVYCFNPVTKKILPFSSISLPPPILVNTLFCDSRGDIWLTTRDELKIYRIDRNRMQATLIRDEAIELFKAGRSKNFISQISEDEQQNIWMISELGNGLLRYQAGTGKWKLLPEADSKNKTILNKGFFRVQAIGNTLWLNSYYMGLLKYTPGLDETRIFTRNDGLLSDIISSSFYDGNKYLWILSEKGITKFDIRTNQVKSNELADMPSSTYGGLTTFDRSRNCLVYGYKNSLSFIYLDRIPFDKTPPPPIVSGVLVNNKLRPVDPTTTLVLRHDENMLTIDFTAIQFLDADKVQFAYQLEGSDKEWQQTNLNRTAQYASLPPGNFTFKIKTGNESGQWSRSFSLLNITIHPPFWRSWWFVSLVVAGALFLFYFLLTRRIQQIRKEAALKHEVQKAFLQGQLNERKRVSADLHDEIGSALSTIGILSDLAKVKARNTAPELFHSLERIGKMSRETIQTMRDMVWAISENPSQSIWERMQQLGSETVFSKGIQFIWINTLKEPATELPFLTRKNLFLAYKEAVNNIVKHSGAAFVEVTVRSDGNTLIVCVKDDGQGFSPDQVKDKGNGIRNFTKRMKEIGGHVSVESSPGNGTKLSFQIDLVT